MKNQNGTRLNRGKSKNEEIACQRKKSVKINGKIQIDE